MEREIKFCGKRVDNGEWVYGSYLRNKYHTLIISDGFSPVWISGAGIDKVIGDIHKVDPKTVGQFTGLRDKNGKEIYEGDVIRSMFSDNTPCLHEIRYDESLARFSAFYLNSIARDSGSTIAQSWITEHGKEIIGNIYSNPELTAKQ